MARARCSALLVAAMRRVANQPEGHATAGCSALRPGMRSVHIRHSRGESGDAPVASPVHVIFDRLVWPGLIEIVRVLHARMEPSRHRAGEGQATDKPYREDPQP